MSDRNSFDARTLAITTSGETRPWSLPASFGSGRYLVQRSLGQGGQKQVYLAKDTRLDRDVVIALLKTDQLQADSVPRLVREAQAMARLGSHPNIVTVYDIGDEGGRPFIVSQFVEGGSVVDLLRKADQHRLSCEQAIQLAAQVCQALIHCHGQGIIHRDLKPGNVWLAQDGTAKLGDFGLAASADFSRITSEGVLVGTAVYMAPELMLGQPAEPRSDLYSLGVMLYELVTGRPPFLGDQFVAVISQHLNSPPVAPSWHNPDVGRALENLILRLLSKTPDERPASATEVAKALTGIGSSSPAAVEPAAQPDTKSLSRLAGGVFVGREQETRDLRAALNEAIAGNGRLFMLVGEPGSGKTRMAEHLATYARLCNAQVLNGTCYEGEGAPAFWPWLQIIRSYVHDREADVLRSTIGPGAADIAQVVSVIKERLPDLPEPPPLEPNQARFRLFDSITTFLKNASKRQPLVLILDDLHWADEPSLRLLQFLARELKDARMLVIGTYRDIELGRQHPLSKTLGELARQGLSARVLLRGLTERDVARFIEMTAGIKPAEKLVSVVYQQTEGNPFFLGEIVRLLVVEGQLESPNARSSSTMRVPEGVREVVGRRLDQLSEECNRILTIASVIGRQFSFYTLEPLASISGDRLFEILDEAMAARVIGEVSDAVDTYTFAHALIRETLYEEITAARRVRLHRRIGEALEALYASNLEAHLPELAYHFVQASPGGDLDKAIDYSIGAGKRSIDQLAYEEAVRHYENAIQTLELKEPADEQRACETLLALGDAQKKAGNVAKARESFLRAATLAKNLNSPAQLGKAALAIAPSVGAAVGTVDEVQVSLLNEALNVLPDQDSSLRAMLLAHLSLANYYAPELREPLSVQAVEMARRLGDPNAQMVALYSRHIAIVASVDTEEKLALATEMLRIAEQRGDKERTLRAHYLRIVDLMELPDMPAVDREIEAYARVARELRQPTFLWLIPFFHASRALTGGRFQECERLAQEALAIARKADDAMAPLFVDTLTNVLGILYGRWEERAEFAKRFLAKYPKIPSGRAQLVRAYCRLGRVDEAREAFEEMAANDFAGLPRDGSWISTNGALSKICSYLGDARRAAIIYERLLPYARRQIVTGTAAIACGSVSRFLGILAATMSRWDEATTHFEDALEMDSTNGARPFVGHIQLEYGAMMLARGRPGDREKALEMLDRALALAKELGLTGVLEEIEIIKSQA